MELELELPNSKTDSESTLDFAQPYPRCLQDLATIKLRCFDDYARVAIEERIKRFPVFKGELAESERWQRLSKTKYHKIRKNMKDAIGRMEEKAARIECDADLEDDYRYSVTQRQLAFEARKLVEECKRIRRNFERNWKKWNASKKTDWRVIDE